jgi:hypothetical integral membrane protein (TIGR02206 family)
MIALVPAAGADALHGFTQFGVVHGLVVCVCLALFATIVWLGRRLDDTRDELRARRALATFALIYWIAYNTWWNWNGLDLTTGLPLQACDISGLVAPFALLTLNRWLRATLYFWAFAFATQAFIQPTLMDGPAHVVFWAFWVAHVVIIACALHDLAVLGFRPDWSDFARAATVCLAWAALALAVDIRLGANYGYIGNPPAGVRIPPLIEAFGPWPQRLLVIAALAAVTFLLLLVPWLVVRRLRAPTVRARDPRAASAAPHRWNG